ncbi:hypothetical protein BJY04DRAFT_219005 [Aspergillus karnatakaensis]|uniref:uncharacterized protein n=1 Tax=Aspergillus karnatakaensis TaxID=1810916 RepID=UPI003CCC94EE
MRSPLPLLTLSALSLFSISLATPFANLHHLPRQQQSSPQTLINPKHPQDTPSAVQYISTSTSFDGPKVIPVNESTFEWWYFDVVQPLTHTQGDDDEEIGTNQPSIAITFHSTGINGFDPLTSLFPFSTPPSGNLIQINLAWGNGKTDAWVLVAEEAIITTSKDGNGASGDWRGSGGSFSGDAEMRVYSVEINAPEKGIVGRIVVESESPAHYPCGPAEAGQNMQVIPGVGWANAIPDGTGVAEFTIRGDEEFRVEGRGYHDHNYGSRPFSTSASSAYWGHGRIGGYNIVWLSVLPVVGEESVSAYVSKSPDGGPTSTDHSDAEVLLASCSDILIRPYGANSSYPPDTTTGAPSGYQIQVEVPGEGLLEIVAERVYTQVDFDFYRRFTGVLRGRLDGVELGEGVGLWEQFALGEGS